MLADKLTKSQQCAFVPMKANGTLSRVGGTVRGRDYSPLTSMPSFELPVLERY